MDPRTVLVVDTIMVLLNGGMLGVLHRGLSPEMQPAAKDWRIGTLLVAAGIVLLAVQDLVPHWLVLPWGNGWAVLGLALYWRAVRRFDGIADNPWIFLPAALTTMGIIWFTVMEPSLSARIAVAGCGWAVPLLGAVMSLYRNRQINHEISRYALGAIMLLTAVFMAWRGVYFALNFQTVSSILDAGTWVNALTPMTAAVLPVIGTTAFLVLCLERLRMQWQRAATIDFLTNLPNRRTIASTGTTRFNAAQRAGGGFAAAIVDIDHFKSVNDRFGHDVGDLALQHVAAILAHSCRGPNMVGRQGGEEFAALLEAISPADAHVAAERMRAAIASAPLVLGGAEQPTTLSITVSIGVGLFAAGDKSLDDILRRADKALYRAKEGGRNRVELVA